jgi:hypothetical protein
MKHWIDRVLTDESFVKDLTTHGLETIRSRHTCVHRTDELYSICEELGVKNLNQTTLS